MYRIVLSVIPISMVGNRELVSIVTATGEFREGPIEGVNYNTSVMFDLFSTVPHTVSKLPVIEVSRPKK